MVEEDKIKNELYSLWSIQDSLLQNYRTMFITTESIILSIATAIVASSQSYYSLILVGLGFILLGIWTTVTQKRARCVTLAQKFILWYEQEKIVAQPFSTFKKYENTYAPKTNFPVKFSNNGEEIFYPISIIPTSQKIFMIKKWDTRIHMEFLLPIIFLLCWIFLLYWIVDIDYLIDKFILLTNILDKDTIPVLPTRPPIPPRF